MAKTDDVLCSFQLARLVAKPLNVCPKCGHEIVRICHRCGGCVFCCACHRRDRRRWEYAAGH